MASVSNFYHNFFFMQVIFYSLALLGGLFAAKTDNLLAKILRMPFFFIVFNYAFLLGTIKGLFLQQSPIWKKVR